MNELKRRAYLDAMGIDSYVSRSQLPGAAVTHRLVVLPRELIATPATTEVGPADAPDVVLTRQSRAPQLPRIETPSRTPPGGEAAPRTAQPRQDAVIRFSLAAIVAGGYLWLEDLQERPLAREQVQLMQAMARALGEAGSPPEVAQFDWPMHNNQQLALGEEAARASVAGFIARKLEQQHCHALVLLGEPCKAWVPLEQLGSTNIVSTVSTAQMLADPQLKKQAWGDLQPLVRTRE
jgi:hypothetical protein